MKSVITSMKSAEQDQARSAPAHEVLLDELQERRPEQDPLGRVDAADDDHREQQQQRREVEHALVRAGVVRRAERADEAEHARGDHEHGEARPRDVDAERLRDGLGLARGLQTQPEAAGRDPPVDEQRDADDHARCAM